ncbi:MAG: glycosyltransferase [Deltaproteobacteria bacterium]|nr:glycosyltransferase [Deltaproteobacteria bacterium]
MVRRRILYTVNRMDVGGSQTHLLQVLRLLDRERFEPLLCCLTGKGALLDTARATGVTVASVGLGGLKSPGALASLARLSRFMRRERIDVVHNYLLRANVVGTLAARAARVPLVLSSKRGCHERRGFELAGARLSNWLSDCVTTNANAVRTFVHANEGCPLEKMVVIPSGIDTDRFAPLGAGDYKTRLGLPADAPVVGIVTRMRVRKGVEEFLTAMAEVRRRHPAARAVVVGEGTLDPSLAALVGQLDLTDHVHLLGRRADMPEVLSAFDLFVLSSHDEGMSNAILEAMAMQQPVVATDVGGTGEVVQEGRTGYLVPSKDPTALAVAIGRVLDDPARARAMGEAGRRVVVEGFSARAMVRQMEGLYTRLLGGTEQGAPAGATLPAAP